MFIWGDGRLFVRRDEIELADWIVIVEREIELSSLFELVFCVRFVVRLSSIQSALREFPYVFAPRAQFAVKYRSHDLSEVFR